MHFTQYYLDCLSQASYLIADETTKQAVVVDPRRDVGEYLEDVRAHGFTVVGVIDTHFHADFLAGHLELARETGAWIGFGQRADADFPIRTLADGERIPLGEVTLQIMETPGHTPESISVLVFENADDDVPHAVLTGDALFIGDVGRPDLLASVGVTADELGRMLYRSVRRLMELPDEVRVFPAHGAGSACGKNLSTERQSTIGEQRAMNHACQPMSEEQFLAIVTEGQPSAPDYFAYDATLNRKLHPIFDAGSATAPIEVHEFVALQAGGAVILDARDPQAFAAGHLIGSVSVPADGRFAETAGMVVGPHEEVLLVAPEGREDEVAVRLARIGFDHVLGHLADVEDAFLEVPEKVERASRLTAHELDIALRRVQPPVVVDVRNPGELVAGTIPGAVNIPLAELPGRLAEIPRDRPVVLHCAGGYRSSVASSLLRREGWADVSDLLGGFGAWAATAPAPVG